MEQQQEEILMRRSFQKKTVALVLSVLARGLKVCRSVDEPVREVFDGFPEDFVFVLGVYGSRHPVVLQNRRTGLYRAHETVAAASQKIPLPPATALAKHFSAGEYDRRQMLEIRFKSVEAAFRMVTGQLSAEQAYADTISSSAEKSVRRCAFCAPSSGWKAIFFRGQWQDGCCRRTRNFPAGVGGCGCGCSI